MTALPAGHSAPGSALDHPFTPFETVAIIGVGMMGGSLGLDLRSRGLARQVIGIDSSDSALTLAHERDAIDYGTTQIVSGVEAADCIVFAVPVGAIPALLETIAPHIRPDALITDLGSTKANIVTKGQLLYGSRFIGGHPMAGAPERGMEAARANLFEGAAWAIVRDRSFDLYTDLTAARVAGLAAALGARPLALDAALHDRLAALVSHLPHVLAFAFADLVQADPNAELARSLAAGSYRDLMRVAAADPAMWSDIFRTNRDCLLAAIAAFEAQLQSLRGRIEAKAD